jgi:hypothetical protein
MSGTAHSDAHRLLESAIQGVLKSIEAQPLGRDRLGPGPLGGVYEDPLAVIGYAVFESVGRLRSDWITAQEQLAKTISGALHNMGSKAWDGYLILATPERASSQDAAALTAIRSNTRRLRKFVITGSELGDEPLDVELIRSSVHRALAPLRPLSIPQSVGAIDPLAGLPARVVVHGLSSAELDAVVSAYVEGKPMIQALHRRLQGRSHDS